MAGLSSKIDRSMRSRSMRGVEEIYRRVLTPGLDNLERVNKMGIQLKSIHMIPYPSQYRPRTPTSQPRSRTHPIYESIVFPLGSKQEELGDSGEHSSQTNRSRSHNRRTKSRLPNVPDSSPMTCKPVLPYYAENITSVPSREKIHRPTSVWTFTNQSERLEREIGALNKCRHLKKTSEIIPHRVDRYYFMSGAPKKIHSRYDIQEQDLEALQELARSRFRSHTTTPSSSNRPTPFSPISSPPKVPKSPYAKEVRKLGHIKAYTFEHQTPQLAGDSCVMCPEYIVPCLYEFPDIPPPTSTPSRYPYSQTPHYGEFSRQRQTTPSDEEEEMTLGALIDKYLPQSGQKPQPKQRSATFRSPSAKGRQCVWLRTRRSWSESDINVLDPDPKVLDVLDLDNKGEYKLNVPLKKFIPSNRKPVKPSPRCCSNFARRKYPRTTLPGKANGRNCKRNLLGQMESKKRAQKTRDCVVLPEVQCYKIRFHQDSRLDKAMVMSTQIESEKTPGREMQITEGLPINEEPKSEVEKAEEDNELLVDTNQTVKAATVMTPADDGCLSGIETVANGLDDKSDDSSVASDWPSVEVVRKGDYSNNTVHSSPQVQVKEKHQCGKSAWGNSYIEVQLSEDDNGVKKSLDEEKDTPTSRDAGTCRDLITASEHANLDISMMDSTVQASVLKSVEFKFPVEGTLAASPRQGREAYQSSQGSQSSPCLDKSFSPSKVQKRPCAGSKARNSKSATDGHLSYNKRLTSQQQTVTGLGGRDGGKDLFSRSMSDQRRYSEPTDRTKAIFTVSSDGVNTRKDDVLAMDFSEERQMFHAKDSDDSDASDCDSDSLTDWDMEMISGVKSSFFKSDRKLKCLRANTKHLNPHTDSNISWVTTEVYSFISPEQRQVFEKHFRALDKSDNGVVSRDDLQIQLFENSTKKDLDLFVKVFDLNKDRTVDLQEFVTVAALNDKLCGNMTLDDSKPLKLDLPKLAYHITAFKEMFDLCDSDGDMSLSIQELMLMITVGVSEEIGTDKSLVDIIVRTVDSDRSGHIEFVEFLSFIPFFLGIFSHLLKKPALIEDIERARCAVRKALKPMNRYRPHFKAKTKDIWAE